MGITLTWLFYENLASILKNIPSKEHVVLLGDFNARVGADHDSWPTCLRQFGVGKMNEDGQRLRELCTYHDMCIANSYFQTKPQHNVSWRHTRSKHWHQLNIILVRRSAIRDVLHTRSYHCADCDAGHSVVCCKIRLQLKRFHRTKTQGNPRIDVNMMSHPDLVETFAVAFKKRNCHVAAWRPCHSKVGNTAGYHAPYSLCHLWEEDLEVARLV